MAYHEILAASGRLTAQAKALDPSTATARTAAEWFAMAAEQVMSEQPGLAMKYEALAGNG